MQYKVRICHVGNFTETRFMHISLFLELILREKRVIEDFSCFKVQGWKAGVFFEELVLEWFSADRSGLKFDVEIGKRNTGIFILYKNTDNFILLFYRALYFGVMTGHN